MPPAPLPIIAGVYYARIEGVCDTKQVTNIVSFKKDGVVLTDPADAANAGHVAVALATAWPDMAPNIHVSYTGVQVSVYALGSPLIPAAVTPLTMTGGAAGTEHFKQVAGRIKHTVTRRGRGSQHSTYISPMSADDVTSNGEEVTTGWKTSCTTNYASFVSDALLSLAFSSPGTWTKGQTSKFQNKVLTPAFYPIVASVPQLLVSSQRRRLGRG